MKFPPLISCRRIKKPMFPLGTNYQKKNMTARYDSRIEVLDLSKQPPRSPRVQIAGYVIAARAVDICRATLAGTNGGYSINAPLEKHFLDFKGLDGPQFQAAVATCKSDEEVAKWLEINGARKTAEEIAKWSTETESGKLMLDPEHRQAFLPYCESKGFSPHKDTTFDCVECDDAAHLDAAEQIALDRAALADLDRDQRLNPRYRHDPSREPRALNQAERIRLESGRDRGLAPLNTITEARNRGVAPFDTDAEARRLRGQAPLDTGADGRNLGRLPTDTISDGRNRNTLQNAADERQNNLVPMTPSERARLDAGRELTPLTPAERSRLYPADVATAAVR